MRKLALAAAVALLLASRSQPAHASCHQDCSALFEVMSWSLVAGIVGGYGYGTGYMVYRDATGQEQTLDYGAAELGINAPLAALFASGSYTEARNGNPGQAALFGGLALTHAVLAAHGARNVIELRNEIRPNWNEALAVAGVAYAANTLTWALAAPGPHGRSYGAAEIAVNAPLAAGLGYFAAERARGGDTGQAVLFGGMAALSGALAIHGAWIAFAPTRKPAPDIDLGFDLGHGVGGEIAPTVVTDGKQAAPGLGASGTW